MSRAHELRLRVDPEIDSWLSKVSQKLKLSKNSFLNLIIQKAKEEGSMSFDFHIPNAELEETIENAQKGIDTTEHTSPEALIKHLRKSI